MNDEPRAHKRLVDGATYTMSDLRRIDPTGGLSRQAKKQVNDLSGLVARVRAQQTVQVTDEPEEVPAGEETWGGLGLLGDRVVIDEVQWR